MARSHSNIIILLVFFWLMAVSVSAEEFNASNQLDSDLSLLFEEDELFISATQSARTLGKAPAIATVITSKQLKNMGARNLLDALVTVPGFGVSYASEFAIENTLEVRGIKTAETEKVLLMIDGHRMNSPFGGSWSMIFDDFPLEQVKRIEIIRGPGSALYGANAFVAAVNIIMKKPEDKTSLSLIAGKGAHQQSHGQLAFGDDSSAIGIAGFYDWMETDGTRQPVASDVNGQSGFTNYWKNNQSAYLTTEYEHFSLTGAYVKKQRGSPLSIMNTVDRTTSLKHKQFFGELGYNNDYDGVHVEAKLGIDHFQWDVSWQLNIPGFANIGHPLATNRTLSGSVQLQFEPVDSHYFTMGLTYEHIRQFDVRHFLDGVDVTATFNHNQDAKRQVTAVYLQDEWEMNNDLLLTVGVRFDHYSDFGSTTNPRVALVWSATDSLDLKLLYGRAFRAPTFLEMYETNNAVAVGNPDLKPEVMHTLEGGMVWKIDHNYHLHTNLFYNRFTDRITRQFPMSTNLGGATIWGVETELKADWREQLYGYLNYSFQKSKDSQTKQQLPDVPQHRIRIGVNTALFDEYLNLNGSLRWDGKRPRGVGDARPDTSSNVTVDMAISTDKLMDGLRLLLKGHNLLNANIYDPAPATVSNGFPRPGRELMAEVEYRF